MHPPTCRELNAEQEGWQENSAKHQFGRFKRENSLWGFLANTLYVEFEAAILVLDTIGLQEKML